MIGTARQLPGKKLGFAGNFPRQVSNRAGKSNDEGIMDMIPSSLQDRSYCQPFATAAFPSRSRLVLYWLVVSVMELLVLSACSGGLVDLQRWLYRMSRE